MSNKKRVSIYIYYPIVVAALSAMMALFVLVYSGGGANVLAIDEPVDVSVKPDALIKSTMNSAPIVPAVTPMVSINNTGVLFPYKEGLKWGYKNSSGEVCIAAVYDDAKEFYGDIAIVCEAGLYGLLDRSGAWIKAPLWDDTRTFGEDLLAVKKDDKWGYVDKSGNVVIDYAFREAGDFSCGRAKVRMNSLFGYIDAQGDVAADYKWDECFDFSGDVAIAISKGKYCVINKVGTKVASLDDGIKASTYKEGFSRIEKSEGVNYLNNSGRTAFKTWFTGGGDFNESLAPVSVKGLWGYIDTKGVFLVEAKYKDAGIFSCGLGAVLDEVTGKWGYTDKHDDLKIPFTFDKAGAFKDGYAVCEIGDVVYAVDTLGSKAELYTK